MLILKGLMQLTYCVTSQHFLFSFSFVVIFLCSNHTMVTLMLDKLNELGMMTSEYVYILPVLNIDFSTIYLTPWTTAGNFTLVPRWKPYFENFKMVSLLSYRWIWGLQ